MSRKNKRVCTTLNYTQHLLILAPAAAGCVCKFASAILVGVPILIGNAAVESKFMH